MKASPQFLVEMPRPMSFPTRRLSRMPSGPKFCTCTNYIIPCQWMGSNKIIPFNCERKPPETQCEALGRVGQQCKHVSPGLCPSTRYCRPTGRSILPAHLKLNETDIHSRMPRATNERARARQGLALRITLRALGGNCRTS